MNIAGVLEGKAIHNKSSSKYRTGLIIAFLAPNYTFAEHTFVTRNSNQATRHSPLGSMDGWARDYHTHIPLLLNTLVFCESNLVE